LLDADAEAFGIIQPILHRRRGGALEIFRNELRTAAPLDSESGTAKLLARQANAVEALFQLGETEPFWSHLGDDSDPRLRTILIGRLSRVVADWRRAFERLPSERNPRIRQAIILGTFANPRDHSPSDRSDQIESLLDLFRHDPDAGVHSAAEWLLRSLEADEQVASEAQRLAMQGPADANWSVTRNGLTFVHISKPGVVIIGSPATEARRDVHEEQREVPIDSSFAISACEVTIRQFLEFRRDFQYAPEVASRSDCPINRVDLYEAMKYCRWLSEQEPDFNPLECCYPPQAEIGPGVQLADDFLVRRGYRLPTVAEWEYAVRAHSATSRFFGNDDADLDRFCWSARNSGEVTQPVGMLMPNPFGLFDVYGNISEWCHELGRGVEPENNQIRGGDYRSTPRFLRSAMPTTLSADRKLSIVGFRVVKISESH
ncbi:MAG: formylglycine-generating enzyme family protein, partial [Planctomycetia bacterium]|nr:formylglycine-generating enzyme family protein [Planctomycetia bacterium]